jgi:hypothetical protein
MKVAFFSSVAWRSLCSSLSLCLLALGLVACGSGTTPMDTSSFESAFASASGDIKSGANQAVTALKAGKLLEGSTALENVAKSNAELTDDQRNAMIDLGATIQRILTEQPEGADIAVFQAIENMLGYLLDTPPSTVGITPDNATPIVAPNE